MSKSLHGISPMIDDLDKIAEVRSLSDLEID